MQIGPSSVPGQPDPELLKQLQVLQAAGGAVPNNPLLGGGGDVVQITASRALTSNDAGAILVNANTVNAYAVSLIPGLIKVTLDQPNGSQPLSVTQGTATALTGATATTASQSRVVLIEETPGNYCGYAEADNPLAAVSAGGPLDAPSVAALGASGYGGANRFVPKTYTYTDIFNAAMAAYNAGGGVVCLAQSVTNLGNMAAPLPLLDNVVYECYGYDASTGSVIPTQGVVISTSTTVPVFATYKNIGGTWTWTYTDLGAAYATAALLWQSIVHNAGCRNMAISGGSYGIKVGALYQGGITHPQFSNVYCYDASQWGAWFENCEQGEFVGTTAQGCGAGHIMYAGSGVVWNFGNYSVRTNFAQYGLPNSNIKTRGIEIKGRGGASLNDVNVFDAQTNGNNSSNVVQAATVTNASSAIAFADMSQYAVDMPMMPTSNNNGFYVGETYFITSMSATTGAGTLTLATTIGGTAIVANNNTAQSFATSGFPGLAIYTDNQDPGGVAYNQQVTVIGVDLENTGTTAVLVQNTNSVNLITNIVPGGNPTTTYKNTFTFRKSHVNLISGGLQSSLDADSNCRVTRTGSFITNKSVGTSSHIGAGVWYSDEAITGEGIALGTAVLALKAAYQPDAFINQGSGNFKINNGLDLYQLKFNANLSFGATGNCSSFVFYGGAGVTGTLPTISNTAGSSNIGQIVRVSNPTANSLTIASQSSQNIIGKGASATTITVATLTDVELEAKDANGTLYWGYK